MTPSHAFRSRSTSSARIDGPAEQRRHAPPTARIAGDRGAPVAAPGLEEAAELYYRRLPRGLAYHHFDSAEAAILFVRDHLSPPQIASSVLQVGEQRYQGDEVAWMVRSLGPSRPVRH